MTDKLRNLQRDKNILVEVFRQLDLMIAAYAAAGKDCDHLLGELQRIHLRLIQKQVEIEQYKSD